MLTPKGRLCGGCTCPCRSLPCSWAARPRRSTWRTPGSVAAPSRTRPGAATGSPPLPAMPMAMPMVLRWERNKTQKKSQTTLGTRWMGMHREGGAQDTGKGWYLCRRAKHVPQNRFFYFSTYIFIYVFSGREDTHMPGGGASQDVTCPAEPARLGELVCASAGNIVPAAAAAGPPWVVLSSWLPVKLSWRGRKSGGGLGGGTGCTRLRREGGRACRAVGAEFVTTMTTRGQHN